MKNVLAVLVLAFTFVMVEAKDKPKVVEVTYECSVDCHACKEKIMNNITYEKGVKYVNVDLETKIVTVKFREDKNTKEDLKKALEKLGYETKEVDKKEETKKS